jgi:hypothetical protein
MCGIVQLVQQRASIRNNIQINIRDSVVGIATRYGWTAWGKISAPFHVIPGVCL